MKNKEIKKVFEKSMKLRVQSIKELGKGVSNINYLIKANNKKFVFRLSANPKKSGKFKEEYNSLKSIEVLNISPKPLYLGKNFLILNYIEGTPFTGKKVTYTFLRKLAKLLAKIHSLKVPANISEGKIDLEVSSIKEYIEYLKKNLKNDYLLNILLNARDNLKKNQGSLNNFKKVNVIAHSDICEQNVLETPKGLALIDFEDLSVNDSAADIAKIFVDFKEPFNESQKKVFLEEYFKIKKDKTLKERIKFYKLIIIFECLLFSICYALRIKNKELHESFLNSKEQKKGLEYAKIMFERAINFGIIDKKYSNLNIEKALK